MTVSHLRRPRYELAPALPLWTPVPLLKRRLVGRPAAVLVVEPEADETDAVLHVRQPVGCDVDAARQSTCRRRGRVWGRGDNVHREHRPSSNLCFRARVLCYLTFFACQVKSQRKLPALDSSQQHEQWISLQICHATYFQDNVRAILSLYTCCLSPPGN